MKRIPKVIYWETINPLLHRIRHVMGEARARKARIRIVKIEGTNGPFRKISICGEEVMRYFGSEGTWISEEAAKALTWEMKRELGL